MKCLLISDLHYALKQLDWVSRVAADFDLVVVAGDHLDISSAVDPRAQIVVILKYLRRISAQTRVIVSSGNHDLDARNAGGEKVARWVERIRELGIPADGDSLDLGGTLFTICPWWDGPEVREQVGRQLARDAERPKDRWVWVYHAPPSDSPTSWGGKNHMGDAELLRWIDTYRPDIVLTGHIHQSPFTRDGSWADLREGTWIFNAGRQIGPIPTQVIIDTDANGALWLSMEGGEAVQLDEPLKRPIPALTELPIWAR